jgi:hypothetical protein
MPNARDVSQAASSAAPPMIAQRISQCRLPPGAANTGF